MNDLGSVYMETLVRAAGALRQVVWFRLRRRFRKARETKGRRQEVAKPTGSVGDKLLVGCDKPNAPARKKSI